MLINDINKAKYGDIILFEPTSFISRVQVWIDNLKQKRKFNYSHGAVFWQHVGRVPIMLESISGCGVHLAKVQLWRNYVIVRPDGLPLMPKEEMATYLGKRYDYSKLWAVVKNKFFGTPLTTDDDEQVICTELDNLTYYYSICPKGQCTPVTLANAIIPIV